MKKTLLIMAAGMGSRYGGGKQVDGMGPNGEIIMEYSIADAKKHGFERVVFIIAPSMVEFFPKMMQERVCDMELAFAVQDYSSLPDWFHVPEGRTKPYGTVHAVLCAKDILGDDPFVVINADDLYGEQAYADIVAPLEACAGKKDTACMLAYPIGATLSGHGEVTRGICQTKDGKIVIYASEAKFTDDPIEDAFFGCGGVAEIPDLQDKLIKLARGGFKHHTAIAEGHVKEILKEVNYDSIRCSFTYLRSGALPIRNGYNGRRA